MWLQRFKRDIQGAVAVEFAIVVPILLLLIMAGTEFSILLTHDRKVTQVSNTVADLVAREENVTQSLSDIFDSAALIMEPFSDDALTLELGVVSFDASGASQVVWSWSKSAEGGGGEPWPKNGAPTDITIPSAMQISGSYLVIAKADYTYSPLFTSFFKDIFSQATLDLADVYFLRSRQVDCVEYINNCDAYDKKNSSS
ncbi:TadE/TadG family type IV pilus assembly protein [Flexibacterium corallicola]|uniref:TadE/TadG family type IV pilus assembly protein n=1 Tax=Flexibacterium corallicola TaxID=3037259 RepID=UPI00286F9321|nr:pilus assembly protein [Pseudovibrio sp. M1P-2-3]